MTLFYYHWIIVTKTRTQNGYEEIWDVRSPLRKPETFQPSLWPDSTPQLQTTWSTETISVSKVQRLQDFPIPSAHAYTGSRRAGEEILPLRRHEEKWNPWFEKRTQQSPHFRHRREWIDHRRWNVVKSMSRRLAGKPLIAWSKIWTIIYLERNPIVCCLWLQTAPHASLSFSYNGPWP